jgi:topoisomerase-4 subunit A
MYGTNAGGTKAIGLKPGDYVVSVIYCNKIDDFVLLTSRNTIKRMRVVDVLLTKRARTGQAVIKKVKTNPYYLLDALKMTPNQYKENLPLYLVCKNGNESIETFSLKYNVSDAGKTIETNKENGDLIWMMLPKPEKPDAKVSGDYLVEDTIFSPSMQSDKPAPIILDDEDISIKAGNNKKNQNLLDDLDAILAAHGVPTNDAYQPNVDSTDDKKEEKKELKFHKISLFDDEN